MTEEIILSKPEITQKMPGLLPLLPMLYVAWADGILTPSEAETIHAQLKKQKWLNKKEKEILEHWLDPGSPPTPEELLSWLKIIRDAAPRLREKGKKSLVDLGLEVSRIGAQSETQRCRSPEACAALTQVEHLLGVVSTEAAHQLLAEMVRPRPQKTREPESSFDVEKMIRLLDGEQAPTRRKIKRLLSDPFFEYQYGLSTSAYREKVLEWCRELAKQGIGALSFPQSCGGKSDLAAFITAFETLALHDLSLTVKFGVQFGLFGGSILNLGTEKHHEKYLHAVGTMELPGCFAMTETGHGSNVRDIETTATFDPDTDEFIVDTPSEMARKDYIGNAADHGRMATVFAQLHIGDESHGVHAFLVPIRDEKDRPMPGVKIEDCGEKMGLNGVDNGRLWFDQVRIPRESLLNRFAQVDSNGAYSSDISSPSQRFFTMLGTLVGGRISVAAAAVSAAKSALCIAVRYAVRRRQFGGAGATETLLLDYPSHQRRLLPPLAAVYALDFALKHLIERYVNRTEADSREVEVLAAGLKAFSTWHTTATIQTCREACGGQGYLSINRFAALKADTDVFTTFEGDNTVLLQLVARGLLTEYKQQFSDMNFLGVVKLVADRAATAISELNPVVTRMTDESHLRDPEFQLGAFGYRIKKRLDDGQDSFVAFTECQDHLINLAKAHVERVILEQFAQGVARVNDDDLRPVLKLLCDLFALSRIEVDKGWFLENGYIEGGKAKAIRGQVEKLCQELRPDAVHLVNAFAIPDACLAAPIAFSE